MFIILARALGFEPRSKVLETSILPLNYTRMISQLNISTSDERIATQQSSIEVTVAGIKKKNFLLEQSTQRLTSEYFANLCKTFVVTAASADNNLFYNFSYLACTYCTAAFADGEFQTFFHRNWLDQLNSKTDVITRHYHFSTFW